eukprot:1955552-Pyramimonas_sp.AAC.1
MNRDANQCACNQVECNTTRTSNATRCDCNTMRLQHIEVKQCKVIQKYGKTMQSNAKQCEAAQSNANKTMQINELPS